MQFELSPRVVADPALFAGKPIIVGTHALVSSLVRAVAAGNTIEVVAQDFSVTPEDVRAALTYAATRADEAMALGEAPVTPQSVSPAGTFADRLAALRAQIVASGDPLLDWDGVATELAERRNERATAETA